MKAVVYNGKEIVVPISLANILNIIWSKGIETYYSEQEDEGFILGFSTSLDFRKFVNIILSNGFSIQELSKVKLESQLVVDKSKFYFSDLQIKIWFAEDHKDIIIDILERVE